MKNNARKTIECAIDRNANRFVEMNSEVKEILLPLCRTKRPDDYVWLSPKTGKPFDDIKKAFISACADAGIEGLVWHDLRATYGTRLGEAGFNAYDIARLMGPANIQRVSVMSQFASWRRRGSHAKKSAPVTVTQPPRSQAGFGHFEGRRK